MIYFNISVYSNATINDYKNQLSDDLKTKYEEITKERMKIYFTGYFLGFLLSLGVVLYNYYISKKKFTTIGLICTVISISFITNYFYYNLHSKKQWMLDYIKTPEDTKLWLNMYKEMKTQYLVGLLCGIIAVIMLGLAFRKK
jgi:hypothetical protein